MLKILLAWLIWILMILLAERWARYIWKLEDILWRFWILEKIFGNFGYWKLLTILLAERWVRFRYWEIYFRDFCYWILENYLDIDDLTLMNFQNSEQVSFSRLHLPSTLPGGGCSPLDYVSHKDKQRQRQRYKQRKEHRERLRLPIFSISRGCVPSSQSCVTQRQGQRQKDTNKGKNAEKDKDYLSSLLLWEELTIILASNQSTS